MGKSLIDWVGTVFDLVLDIAPEKNNASVLKTMVCSSSICWMLAVVSLSPLLFAAFQVEESAGFFVYEYLLLVTITAIVAIPFSFVSQYAVVQIAHKKYHELKAAIAGWLRREQAARHTERILKASRRVQQEQTAVAWRRLLREHKHLCLPAPESTPFLLFAHRQAPLRIP
jgi:hypothetical protein